METAVEKLARLKREAAELEAQAELDALLGDTKTEPAPAATPARLTDEEKRLKEAERKRLARAKAKGEVAETPAATVKQADAFEGTEQAAAPVEKKVRESAAPKADLAPVAPGYLVLDFAPDVKELLKGFLAIFSGAGVKAVSPAKEVTEVKEKKTAPVAEAEPKEDKKTGKADTTETVSLTTLRELINVKAAEKKSEGIKASFAKVGAKNATELKPEKYAELYELLKAL